jgi:hypothetical protein
MNIFTYSIKYTGALGIVCACAPLLNGWQAVDLQEYLVSRRAQEHVRSEESLARMREALKKYPSLSAYKILEKSSAADMALESKRVDSQTWLQGAQMHMKASFTTYIQRSDTVETRGSVSQSMLLPRGESRSQWVQTYQTQGIPFTWDVEDRAWKHDGASLPGEGSSEQLSWSLMRTMYSVDENSVDLSTVELRGVEQYNGRECFVLQFDIDRAMLKKNNFIGSLTKRLLVDTETFLPRMVRAEGTFDNAYILQISEFSSFNALPPLQLPESVAGESGRERATVRDKIKPITQEVAAIRAWKPLENISVEFIDRLTLRQYVTETFDAKFTPAQAESQGLILKWLGLLDAQADYRTVMINSETTGIAGLYDPKRKKVFIGDWIPPVAAEAVIAHEIAHAYQDAEVGLEAFLNAAHENGSVDEQTAHNALAEGEATAVMLEYLLKDTDQDQGFKDLEDLFTLIEQKLFPADGRADKGLTYNLYGWGARFVQSYLKEHSWADLSSVYRDPPSTMKQIMHPHIYFFREGSATAGAPGISRRVGPDWLEVYRVHLGEFFIMLFLRQQFDAKTVLGCTKKYTKDDCTIYRTQAGRQVLVFVSQWESASAADRFVQLYRQALVKKYPKNNLEEQKDYAILSTEDSQIFITSQRDDQVQVVWTAAGSASELPALVQSITGQMNPENRK